MSYLLQYDYPTLYFSFARLSIWVLCFLKTYMNAMFSELFNKGKEAGKNECQSQLDPGLNPGSIIF